MEVKNVEALFDDILNNDDEYYVGNLLITPSGDSSTEFDIVDGQQRITTISLYLLAIYYHLLRADNDDSKIKEFKSKEYKKKFNRALQDIPHRLINEDDNLASLQLLKKD